MNHQLTGSAMIERAIELALQVHTGQKDKYGVAYILHPLRVGLGARNDIEKAAGFLHDVIEDSSRTIDDLREEGFPEEVLTIVDHVSKRKGEEWEHYIHRVMEHEPSMHVKLRDLVDNMDASRIPVFKDKDYDRFSRYVWAWHEIRRKLGME